MKTLVTGLLLAAALQGATNTAQTNLQLDTQSEAPNQVGYNGVKLFVGAGDESVKDALYFSIDISHPFTIVGDKTPAKWGIDCKDPKTNSCQVDDPAIKEDFINFFYYKYLGASLFARFSQDQKLATDGLKKLPVRLMEGGQAWYLGGWGLVGLAPRGDFGNYLRATFDKDVSIAFKYKLTTPGNANNRLTFDAYALLNPVVGQSDLLYSATLEDGADFWTVRGDLLLPDTEYNYKNQVFCLTTSSAEIIQTIDADDFNRRIQELACSGKYWTDCTKSTADISKLKPLTITLGAASFSFTPQEYTYFSDKGILMSRIGDVGVMRSDRQCPPHAELGIGNLFFQKYFPILTFLKAGGAQVGFLSKLDVVEKKSNFWLILAIIGAIIAIAVILYIILQRKQKRDEEYNAVN